MIYELFECFSTIPYDLSTYQLQKLVFYCVNINPICLLKLHCVAELLRDGGSQTEPHTWSTYEIIHIKILYCSCRWTWRVIIAVNFPTWAIGKQKPEKSQGFNGTGTRDLRDTSAMLHQLSYEATHWERGQFVEFISSSFSKLLLFILFVYFSPYLFCLDWKLPLKEYLVWRFSM